MAETVHGTPEPVARLIEEFSRLPGIGPKSAQRLAYHVLRATMEEAQALADSVVEVKRRMVTCDRCFNITERNPCVFCDDTERDSTAICVVEQPLDVLVIERTGGFRGRYHVLHGVLNPVEGIGPDDVRIAELVARARENGTQEIIMATNPSLEGEATAMYIQRLVEPHGIRVTRLARGLSTGADLEYTDDLTLARALEGRQAF